MPNAADYNYVGSSGEVQEAFTMPVGWTFALDPSNTDPTFVDEAQIGWELGLPYMLAWQLEH